MVGGDEHNDIESRTGCVGYDNWAEAPRRGEMVVELQGAGGDKG